MKMLNNIRECLHPHEIKLQVNAIVMLIRNLSITDGLCNGTRLKITKLFKYNIEAEIITGEYKGNKVFIPRITLNTCELSSLPFILYYNDCWGSGQPLLGKTYSTVVFPPSTLLTNIVNV